MSKRTGEGEAGSSRKGTVVFRSLVVFMLALLIGLVFYHKLPGKQDSLSRERELSARLGILPDMSEEEIQDALNRQVAEGMLNVSMNPLPEFPSGKREGNVRIQNIAGNHYSIKVTYVRSDTGEAILTTRYIDPGYYVEEMKLDKELPKGQYLCVANVEAYDPGSLEAVGQTGMEVLITVKE